MSDPLTDGVAPKNDVPTPPWAYYRADALMAKARTELAAHPESIEELVPELLLIRFAPDQENPVNRAAT